MNFTLVEFLITFIFFSFLFVCSIQRNSFSFVPPLFGLLRLAGGVCSGVKSTELIKAYDKQVQALFKEKDEHGKSINVPKTLYTSFMMLPFIHFESDTLCKKPLADITECEPFELKELAEMFGFSRANILISIY